MKGVHGYGPEELRLYPVSLPYVTRSIDTSVTQNSSNLITSGGVYNAIQNVTPFNPQNPHTVLAGPASGNTSDTPTFRTIGLSDLSTITDTSVEENSSNLITSGAVYNAIQEVKPDFGPQSPHTVYAGPNGDSSDVPTFRPLAIEDMPFNITSSVEYDSSALITSGGVYRIIGGGGGRPVTIVQHVNASSWDTNSTDLDIVPSAYYYPINVVSKQISGHAFPTVFFVDSSHQVKWEPDVRYITDSSLDKITEIKCYSNARKSGTIIII